MIQHTIVEDGPEGGADRPSRLPLRAMAPERIVRLLVCGDAERGDDGAALYAVAHVLPALDQAMLAQLEVRRCSVLVAADLAGVPPGRSCLILDTVTGVLPGEVVHVSLED